MNKRPFCVVPFVEAFSGIVSTYRDCCSTSPCIDSQPEQSFEQWWHSAELNKFRQELQHNQWPDRCSKCRIQEEAGGHSFRQAVNAVTDKIQPWPQRWNLKFGNVCNLSCWTCNELSSSVIAQHKRQINILPADYADPTQSFLESWPGLKQNILKSYDYYPTVTLTLLGGEPLYIKQIPEFLEELSELGLAPRTRLEFHTNATQFRTRLFVDYDWNYVCIFLSLDAVGKKAEWLRYGCDWAEVEKNIDCFKQTADYLEVHCTLSVLNLADLPELDNFCRTHQLPLKVLTLSSPSFMSLTGWSGTAEELANQDQLSSLGYGTYYDLVGTDPVADSKQLLSDYIKQFDTIRTPLHNFDPRLAQVLNLM